MNLYANGALVGSGVSNGTNATVLATLPEGNVDVSAGCASAAGSELLSPLFPS